MLIREKVSSHRAPRVAYVKSHTPSMRQQRRPAKKALRARSPKIATLLRQAGGEPMAPRARAAAPCSLQQPTPQHGAHGWTLTTSAFECGIFRTSLYSE